MKLRPILLLILLIGTWGCTPTAPASIPTVAILPTLTPTIPAPSPTADLSIQPTLTPPPLFIGIPTPPPRSDIDMTAAQALSATAPLTDTLDEMHPTRLYHFTGQAGAYITTEMMWLSGHLDPALTLYNAAGEALAIDHNTGGTRTALLRNVRLPQTGTYYIESGSSNQLDGQYRLSLSMGDPVPVTPTIDTPPSVTPIVLNNADTATDTPLPPGQAVTGRIQQASAINRHLIQTTQETVITIGVYATEGSALQPVIELYDLDGNMIGSATSQANQEAVLTLALLPRAGIYSVFVAGASQTSGAYQIAYGTGVNYQDQPQGETLADTAYDGQLMRRGNRDMWTLWLNAGDIITIAASPTNTALDPVLELYGPRGDLITSDDNGGGFPNALITRAEATITGQYTVYVSGASGSSTGPYRLIWRYINAAPTAEPEPPRILLFSLTDTVDEGLYSFYPFQGIAGQTVRIHVIAQSNAGFDPVAALIGPDGEVVANGDDSANTLNPRFSVTLPADGTYQVRVNGYLSGGTFDLYVERLF